MKVVESAIAMSSKGSKRMTDGELERHVGVLQRNGVEFPSQVKLDLLDKTIEKWVNDSRKLERVDDMLACIEPWGDSSSVADETMMFDPLDPKVALTDGSSEDKIQLYKDTLVRKLLIPILKQGGESVQDVGRLCATALKRFGKLDDIDEHFGETLHELLCVFRAVGSLVEREFLEGASQGDFDMLLGALTARSARNTLCLVAATPEQSRTWSALKEEFYKYAGPTKEAMPELKAAFEAFGTVDSKVDASEFLKHLTLLDRVSGLVRPSLSDRLKKLLEAYLQTMVQGALAEGEAGKGFSADPKVLQSIVDFSEQCFGGDDDRTKLSGLVARKTTFEETAPSHAWLEAHAMLRFSPRLCEAWDPTLA